MNKSFQLFWVSQVGILIRNNKCLILEFAEEGEWWGLPGGRIDEGEVQGGATCEDAFRREIKEELGIENFEIFGPVFYDYTKTKHPVIGIANLIFNTADDIKLSEEHRALKWVGADELEGVIFKWPCAKKMIEKGFAAYKMLGQTEN